MTDDTWNPGEDDERDGRDTDDAVDEEVGSVVRSRGKRRIEATRAPNRSGRSPRSFVVRKGRVETDGAEEDG